MSLQFLRPMGLPRPTTLRYFLGAARYSTTTEATSISTPISSPPSSTTTPNQPYRVTRTPSNSLPVYLLAKRGGNLKQTRVRRIEGDVGVLKTQLQEALGLDEKEIAINQLTKHIIIRGWKKPQVEEFLKTRHF